MICHLAAIMTCQNSNYNCLTGLCKRKMGRKNGRTVKGRLRLLHIQYLCACAPDISPIGYYYKQKKTNNIKGELKMNLQ